MATSYFGKGDNTSGAGTSTAPTVTLPGSIVSGDIGIAFISAASGSITLGSTTAGWTAYNGGTAESPSSAIEGWLYFKTLDGTETTFAGTLSATSRWTAAVVVIRGGVLGAGPTLDNVVAASSGSNSVNTTHSAITPVANNCMQVAIGVHRNNVDTSAGTVTPPAGWTEAIDASSSQATTPLFTVWADYKQLSGQAGSNQSLANGTPTKTGVKVSFTVTVAPSSGGATVSGVVATATSAALPGTVTAVRKATVSGVVATATITARAGAVVVPRPATVTGVRATATIEAHAGSVSAVEDGVTSGETDTIDRAAGMRYRTGIGYAIVEVPVEPEPTIVASAVDSVIQRVLIAADSLPSLSATDGIVAPVTATEVRGVWGRFRIKIGNRDVTFFRDVPSVISNYQLTDPYGWGPASVGIPSVFFGEVDDFGEPGELRWLRKGAPVDFEQAVAGEIVSAPWHGQVDEISVDSNGRIVLNCSGAVSGALAQRWRPQRLFRHTADLAFLLSVAVGGQTARSYTKTPNWYTSRADGRVGIEVENFDGGMTYLAFTDKALGEAVTATGDSWTILPTDEPREVDLIERDLDTVDFTVYLGARGVSPALKDDTAESFNRYFGEGVAPSGERWRNAFYPNLGPEVVPEYPFTGGDTFGLGTTNADTDTGDGIFVLQNELLGSSLGFGLPDRSDEYNRATESAVSEVQRLAGLTDTGNVNPATWRAVFGDEDDTWSLGQAEIRPLVYDRRTERNLYSPNGSAIGRNPHFDRSVKPIDRHINFGTGVSKDRARRWCLREYNRSQRRQWRGTIQLTADVIEGNHTHGDAATAMSRLDIRAGMNAKVVGLGGSSVKMHVAASNVTMSDSGPSVSLAVDCQGRPAVELASILQRDEEARGNPARRALLEHRRGSQQSDALVGWDKEAGAGIVRRTQLQGEQWNVVQVVGGQSGTLQAIELQTGNDEAAFACLISAREITETKLNRLIKDPLYVPAAILTWDGSNLDGGISAGDTSIDIDDASGLPSTYPFRLIISIGAASEEVVSVSDVTGNTLTVGRGKAGTHAQSHSDGASIQLPGVDDADETEQWTDTEIASLLFDRRFGLYAAGTGDLPCGYFPKKHTSNKGEVTDHPITGAHVDSAGVSFWTQSTKSPWLYLAVWPDRDCWIEGQFAIQISEGS